MVAARFRRDNTLERATVFAYESPAPCPPFTGCVPDPSTGNPSSYVLDTSPPYVNLPVRQCEYEVERAGPGDDGNVDIPGLVDQLRVERPRAPVAVAAAGGRRPLSLPAARMGGLRPVERHVGRTRTGPGTTPARDRAVGRLGAGRSPRGAVELLVADQLVHRRQERRSALAGAVRGAAAAPVDSEQLRGVHERARGTGFSAYLVDRTYGTTAFELVDEMLHRDVMTTDDDLHRVSVSERSSTALSAALWRRVTSTELTDSAGQILATVARTEFDPAHVDSPGQVTTCGGQGQECRDDRFTYHANGELATHTRPDGAVESTTQSPFCGTETHTDEGGRPEVTVYDDRCRVSSRSFRGVVTTYAYDGQNRVTRRTTTPNGGAPTTTVRVTQDDDFQFVQDVGYLEPRLRELRDEDKRLWLTYLDDFGRVTRRVVCSQQLGSSPPTCAVGTGEVLELNFWGTDGLLFASARPYVEAGPGRRNPGGHRRDPRRGGAGHPAAVARSR